MGNMKSLGGEVFEEPDYIEDALAVEVLPEEEAYEVKDGVLVGYRGAFDVINIPEGVREISAELFLSNARLKRVKLEPKSAVSAADKVSEAPKPDKKVYTSYSRDGICTRVDKDSRHAADGQYMIFGSYPKSLVRDVLLVSTLGTKAGALPNESDDKSWIPYGYFRGNGTTGSARKRPSFMWYQDIEHKGEWYRGVYFSAYRPWYTDKEGVAEKSHQTKNGYKIATVYWFKFEPLLWQIEAQEGKKLKLLSDMLLDAQPYQSCLVELDSCYVTDSIGKAVLKGGENVYANNYEYSTVRAWLNDEFYNTAFVSDEKKLISTTEVDNSSRSAGISETCYLSPSTFDNVTLPSLSEAKGYDSVARCIAPTEYARCQGLYFAPNNGHGWWWLRSPSASANGKYATAIGDKGELNTFYMNNSVSGIRPVIWIENKELAVTGKPAPQPASTYKRVDLKDVKDEHGKQAYFGSYPRRQLTDAKIISALRAKMPKLPDAKRDGEWKRYNYYIGTGKEGTARNNKHFMWYIDLEHGGKRYRGVYFTEYRPRSTNYAVNPGDSFQVKNKYLNDTVAWFIFEPIKWRIVEEKSGMARLIAEELIDAQAYQDCCIKTPDGKSYISDNMGKLITGVRGGNVFANNYEHSSIRAWLNRDFLDSAFNEAEKSSIYTERISNNSLSTNTSNNPYACADTADKVFLPSAYEMRSLDAGFKVKDSTDYARSQGAFVYYSTNGKSSYWLRSANSASDSCAVIVNTGGAIDRNTVNVTFNCVCPSIWLKL